MQPTIFTKMKVNNEIELCEVSDMECKDQIQKVLLQHRISYYILWPKNRLFARKEQKCIFCINDNYRDTAEKAIKSLGSEIEGKVEFLMSKAENDFFKIR